MTLFARVLAEFLFLPAMAWLCPLYAGWAWLDRKGDLQSSIFTGIILMAIACAFAYHTGYRGFIKAGRKGYFMVVFVLPIVIGAIGILFAFAAEAGAGRLN